MSSDAIPESFEKVGAIVATMVVRRAISLAQMNAYEGKYW